MLLNAKEVPLLVGLNITPSQFYRSPIALESITIDAEAIMHHDLTDILEDLLTLHLPLSSAFTTYVDLSVDLPLLDQSTPSPTT